jgi:hypothetical protein
VAKQQRSCPALPEQLELQRELLEEQQEVQELQEEERQLQMPLARQVPEQRARRA